MHVSTYNGFNGFYVISKSEQSFDGLKFHHWAETVAECEQWIANRKPKKFKQVSLFDKSKSNYDEGYDKIFKEDSND